MAREPAAEPLFPIDDIQGDLLVGLNKKWEKFVFFRITGAPAFRAFLQTLEITSMRECLTQKAAIKAHTGSGLAPTPGLNVAFTHAGLELLGQSVADPEGRFAGGMPASRAALADPDPAAWPILGPGQPVDGVFLVAGATEAEVDDTIALRLAPAGANGWAVEQIETGRVRPRPASGHEHFGYADGVSQPAPRGRIADDTFLEPSTGADDAQADPGRDLLWPGEFIFGYPGQDPAQVAAPDEPLPGTTAALVENGAFLVIRRLAQKVPEFDLAVKAAVAGMDGATSEVPSATLFGAQLVGRWKSGAALINAPTADDPAFDERHALTVNAFEFGGDRDGLVCPWGAHIRKAYPRDDVRHVPAPEPKKVPGAEAFTQTHRMMRRGIAFGPELTSAEALSGNTTEQRGLLFACYVTSIADQFEFVQQQWINADDFSQLGTGVDALIGQGAAQALPFVGAAPASKDAARKPQVTFERFVEMQGGEYFFAPSIPTIRGL